MIDSEEIEILIFVFLFSILEVSFHDVSRVLKPFIHASFSQLLFSFWILICFLLFFFNVLRIHFLGLSFVPIQLFEFNLLLKQFRVFFISHLLSPLNICF